MAMSESSTNNTVSPALGLLLNAEYPLAELARLGRVSEELGYRALWYTDIRFARECYLGLAAIAGATHELKLGPGVTDPYTRHPAITAASIATLDELSGGRAQLGLGTGGHGFGALGIERRLPVAALRETVQTVRALIAGEQVETQGKVVSLARSRLDFDPVRRRVPIYIATHGPQISRLAGEIADGVLIANTLLPEMLAFYLGRLRDGAARIGRDMSSLNVGLRVEACIADDFDAAFDVMRRRMASRLIGQYPHWDYLKEMGIDMPDAFTQIAKRKDQSLLDEAAKALPEQVVEATVLAGDPQRVAEQLAGVLRREVATITIRPHHVAGDSVESVIRAFAQDVMPRVAQILSKSVVN